MGMAWLLRAESVRQPPRTCDPSAKDFAMQIPNDFQLVRLGFMRTRKDGQEPEGPGLASGPVGFSWEAVGCTDVDNCHHGQTRLWFNNLRGLESGFRCFHATNVITDPQLS